MPGTASPSCHRPWPICVEEPSARLLCKCAMPTRLRHEAPRRVRGVAALACEGCTHCRSQWLDQTVGEIARDNTARQLRAYALIRTKGSVNHWLGATPWKSMSQANQGE